LLHLNYGAESYLHKLLLATTQVLTTDLPAIYNIDYEKINSLEPLANSHKSD